MSKSKNDLAQALGITRKKIARVTSKRDAKRRQAEALNKDINRLNLEIDQLEAEADELSSELK